MKVSAQDIKVDTLTCGKCNKPAIVKFDTGWSRFYAECTECKRQWFTTWKTVLSIIDGMERYCQLDNETLVNILKKKGLKPCFGNMVKRQKYFDRGVETEGETVTEIFANYINAKIDKADEHARQLALCSRCDLFDRCKVLSNLE